MRTLYLVRHAEKAWKNGRRPVGVAGQHHDPPLLSEETTSSTLQTTIDRMKDIKFDQRYCSPFLRTRQTAKKLSDQPFELTAAIGEFLGNQRRGCPELDVVTVEQYPALKTRKMLMSETVKRLELRVRSFIESLPADGTFLIVSHGIVLSKICGSEVVEGGLCVFNC